MAKPPTRDELEYDLYRAQTEGPERALLDGTLYTLSVPQTEIQPQTGLDVCLLTGSEAVRVYGVSYVIEKKELIATWYEGGTSAPGTPITQNNRNFHNPADPPFAEAYFGEGIYNGDGNQRFTTEFDPNQVLLGSNSGVGSILKANTLYSLRVNNPNEGGKLDLSLTLEAARSLWRVSRHPY